jgi:hypothetical protein
MARQPPRASSAAPAVGGDHRDDRRGDGHIGELCKGGLALEQVADNGQSDRHARAGAGTLHDTPHQEGGQRVGERAADSGDNEEQAGEHHDRLSAISIGSGPIEKRRDGETEHE